MIELNVMEIRKKKFVLFNLIVFICISVVLCSCESKNTIYYESGELKEISFLHFNTKQPYKKTVFSKEGKLINRTFFDKEGYLLSELELSENGDSTVSLYSNNERYSYSIFYTQCGDIYFFPYENGKKTGVVRYYKKGKLLKRLLYVQDSVIAVDFYNKLEKGKSIVINDIHKNKTYEREFVNNDFDTYVSQCLRNSDHQLLPCGTYFMYEKSTLIDTVFSDFVLMDLPDTLKRDEIVEGKVVWNSWNKNNLYLEYYMNDVDGYPQNSLQGKTIESTKSNINFEFKCKQPGYHFLSGHAILRNRDSSIYQNFIIYDDFYVLP